MPDREKVIAGLEICSEHGSWHGLDCEHNEAYKDCPYRGCETGCIVTIAKDAIALLKEQEGEIERLKRPDCEHANHDGAGCLGYCGCEQDDEPIEACKQCEKYTGNICAEY